MGDVGVKKMEGIVFTKVIHSFLLFIMYNVDERRLNKMTPHGVSLSYTFRISKKDV